MLTDDAIFAFPDFPPSNFIVTTARDPTNVTIGATVEEEQMYYASLCDGEIQNGNNRNVRVLVQGHARHSVIEALKHLFGKTQTKVHKEKPTKDLTGCL